jgi:hypothetical protein
MENVHLVVPSGGAVRITDSENVDAPQVTPTTDAKRLLDRERP